MAIIKARAKINLFFQIIGKRMDGYHLIESLNVFANDIYDLIEINPANFNSTIINGGEFAESLINEENNLINKALDTFSGNSKYHCQLTKNIPIRAGLGGGSADAAMVAKFLEPTADISSKLLSIGADSPTCYYNKPAFCSGIGEIIKPLKNFPNLYLVLINPKKTLLTKDVFKHNQHINTPIIKNKPLDFFNDLNNLISFISPLNNDLSEAAIQLLPEIKIILDLLGKQDGCLISRMSGSGPTCFAIFTNKETALQANKTITNELPNYWVKYTSA